MSRANGAFALDSAPPHPAGTPEEGLARSAPSTTTGSEQKVRAGATDAARGAVASAERAPGKPAPTTHVPSLHLASRAGSLVAEAMERPTSWERLRGLTDRIGARLAGSEGERRAIAWAKAEFEHDGFSVRLEPVKVPVWVRGSESAAIVSPVPQPLVMLGLGGSVGTPPEGIVAPVAVVSSYEELETLGRAKVEGRIVLYDNPFVRTGDEMSDYGRAVKYRSGGASAAARLGAAAVLIRSVATASLRTPHTGMLSYAVDAPKIPAAAVTIEDAMLVRRLFESGEEVRVRLVMGARTEPDADSANVVAEIRGREKPEEIVLIGAHLDSWDVGTGAIDDGAGCAVVLETMRMLAGGPRPRRTVRAVLFANEENGLRGGKGYRDAHMALLGSHVAALEFDSGGGRALGIGVDSGEGGLAALADLLVPILAPIGAGRVTKGGGGADISPLEDHGVPQLSLNLDTTRYFDWHHTMADTLDKVDPWDLQQATAAFAATAWALAEWDRTLPRLPPPRKSETQSHDAVSPGGTGGAAAKGPAAPPSPPAPSTSKPHR